MSAKAGRPLRKRRMKRVDRPAPRPLSEMPDPMLPAEVAELLRCSTRHIYTLLREGELKCVRVGKSKQAPILVYQEDYEAYINRLRGKE